MKALDRLRALGKSEKVPDPEPTKLTKGGFGGFVSTGEGASPNISGVGDNSELREARYRWLILEPDGRRREVCCLPEMTADELSPCYRGARLLPLPDLAAVAGDLIRDYERKDDE